MREIDFERKMEGCSWVTSTLAISHRDQTFLWRGKGGSGSKEEDAEDDWIEITVTSPETGTVQACGRHGMLMTT